MTVSIDTTRCIGCGMCAAAAPGVFRVVGRFSTVQAQPAPDQESGVRMASDGCPVNAIEVKK